MARVSVLAKIGIKGFAWWAVGRGAAASSLTKRELSFLCVLNTACLSVCLLASTLAAKCGKSVRLRGFSWQRPWPRLSWEPGDSLACQPPSPPRQDGRSEQATRVACDRQGWPDASSLRRGWGHRKGGNPKKLPRCPFAGLLRRKGTRLNPTWPSVGHWTPGLTFYYLRVFQAPEGIGIGNKTRRFLH